MLTDDEIEQLKRRKLCFHCVGEAFLREEISTTGKKVKCSYCKRTARCYSIGDMAGRIEFVFDQHYTRTANEPNYMQSAILSDKESSYEWERAGEETVDAIMNAADIPGRAAQDIQSILEEQFSDFDSAAMGEETEFSSECHYKEKGTNDARLQAEWQEFERSLKTEARFFSRTGARLLASVFDGIDAMQTRDGRSMIVNAGPNTSLAAVYRARAFQSDDKLEVALTRPNKDLGSPPSVHARAGRMNARGISIFYGANDPDVALAEVRPPVGSQVAVARFEIIRPVRLLDLTALSDVSTHGSIFDPSLNDQLERTMFLRNLSQRITMPVMPDDEVFEYLPTQAIADFLATETATPVDGIIFPSVQVAGEALNVALFHTAARVEEVALPKGTEVTARLGWMEREGWEQDYTVIERVPPAIETPPPPPKGFAHIPMDFEAPWESPDPDGRPVTLKIDLESLRVHIVEAVKFKTVEYEVKRHRWEKREPDF